MGKIQAGDEVEYDNLGDAFRGLQDKEVPDRPKIDPVPPPAVKLCEVCGIEMFLAGVDLYSRGRMRISTWSCPRCRKTEQLRELVAR